MNEYQRMLAYLKILYHNFATLHRNLVRDEAWFGNHKQLGKWYEMTASALDDLAEAGLMLGYTDPSIKDAVLAYGGQCLDSRERRLTESLRLAYDGFQEAVRLMEAAEPAVPPDVQNKLQEYAYQFHKEANYKLAHALGLGTAAPSHEEEDD